MPTNLSTCLTCCDRERPCAGPCHCDHSGREIREHARAELCPIGKFGVKGNLPPRGAGDVLAATIGMFGLGAALKRFIRRVTGRRCGCVERQEGMNKVSESSPSA